MFGQFVNKGSAMFGVITEPQYIEISDYLNGIVKYMSCFYIGVFSLRISIVFISK
jgi:hypothetical protein